MAFEDSSLQGRYDLVNLGVASGTQITHRTSAVVTKLTTTPGEGESSTSMKATVVALTAAAKAAGKLISIVEIAKRELAAQNVRVYQYNALSARMTSVPRRAGKAHEGEDCGAGGEDEVSDDAFEVMGQARESSTKKRNVPVMTIYLSTVSVRELKVAFGEQT